jgi:hypothetical protein
LFGEGYGEIDRDGRFAYAAFAGGYTDDVLDARQYIDIRIAM